MSDILTFARLDFEAGGFSYRGLSLAEAEARGIADAEVLPALKAWLGTEIDRHAEVLRLSVITPGVGKALEYQETAAQADAALAWAEANPGKAPDPADYPMLAATVGIDADPGTGKPAADVLGVARGVRRAKTAWREIGASLKAANARGRQAVDGAGSVADAGKAFDTVAWPSVA